MAVSDSMFLFEIVVEGLVSFATQKGFLIKSQFADIFTFTFKDPNESDTAVAKNKKTSKRKKKRKEHKPKTIKKRDQSVLFASSIELLHSNMKMYPLELSLWDKINPENKLGSTFISWSQVFFDYLNLNRKSNPPASVCGAYNVFDEVTSKRMAEVKLKIKLSKPKDKFSSSIRALADDDKKTFLRNINSKTTNANIYSTATETNINLFEETGVIKTFFNGKKRRTKSKSKKKMPMEKEHIEIDIKIDKNLKKSDETSKITRKIVNTAISDTYIKYNKRSDIITSKSCTILGKNHFNFLNYIYGHNNEPFGEKVYTVGYFTVENASTGSSASSKESAEVKSSEEAKLKTCDGPCQQNELVSVTKCKNAKPRLELEKPDERILLDIKSLTDNTCPTVKQEITTCMKTNIKMSDDSCFCSCDCSFGFVNKTTVCGVCGGYEVIGEDFTTNKPKLPFPCPVYHKLEKPVDKQADKRKKNQGAKNNESDTARKDILKDERFQKFKFFGYTAPQIGHSQCAMFGCMRGMGDTQPVPKNMGWLWNSENVTGLKFRPMWKPGAVSKNLLRMLRMFPNDGTGKKKRKKTDTKKPLKRPLLVVQKKDGEYTVTMETMKTFNKPRTFNQYPYEDKPVLTYTIGRTDEENYKRQRKREHEQRKHDREKREFIESTFEDMCKEICVKTYEQALGLLPSGDRPDCSCFPAIPDVTTADMGESCSCSISKGSGSDTDLDEWIVEFTPPNAKFDPKYKPDKVSVDNCSQYTYLDYRVKLFDIYGDPIPRFFKGPDGKTQCSDLGGFWSPDHKWLEINEDGFIAPDGRWAPFSFIGPSGDMIDCEGMKFEHKDKVVMVGCDGFVDSQNKWKFYPKGKGAPLPKQELALRAKQQAAAAGTDAPGINKKDKAKGPRPDPHKLCLPHDNYKKPPIVEVKNMTSRGVDTSSSKPNLNGLGSKRRRKSKTRTVNIDNFQCKHPEPSDKGIVAVDDQGNKTYFRIKDPLNKRPKERMIQLDQQGISLSSFHAPCFHSFISTAIMKKELREKLTARYNNAQTQT